jgi:hypothetical protein
MNWPMAIAGSIKVVVGMEPILSLLRKRKGHSGSVRKGVLPNGPLMGGKTV